MSKEPTPGFKRHMPKWTLALFWPWWANLFFMFGSILWLIAPIYCWIDQSNPNSPCDYVALAATICYLMNGPFYVMDWYVVRAAYEPQYFEHGVPSDRMSWFCFLSQRIDYYLLANFTFFMGTFGDICTTIIDIYIKDPYLSTLSDIVATHLWMISGVFTLMNWYHHRRARRFHRAPVQFTLWPLHMSSGDPPQLESSPYIPGHSKHYSGNSVALEGDDSDQALLESRTPVRGEEEQPVFYMFHWGGWGDWFFLPGGLLYAIGSYQCYFWNNFDACSVTQSLAGLCYLIDSFFYFPDLNRQQRHPEWYSRIRRDVIVPGGLPARELSLKGDEEDSGYASGDGHRTGGLDEAPAIRRQMTEEEEEHLALLS